MTETETAGLPADIEGGFIMKIEKAVLEIPGVELYDENPLPMFRSPQHDQCFASDGSLSEAETEALGRHTGFRVLPYCMQDCFSLETRPCKYETIVMENEKLRADVYKRQAPERAPALWVW